MGWYHLLQKSKKLQKSFIKLDTEMDVFNFLRDLLTEWEILEFSQRLDIAEMLHNGKSYKKIEEATWASSTTIARVAKFLNGGFGGYKKILSNFEKNKTFA
jgi:TrpR-related protein YerC/YecD